MPIRYNPKRKSKKISKKLGKLKELNEFKKIKERGKSKEKNNQIETFHYEVRGLIINPRTARFREALNRIAQKFDKFIDFSEYYWNGLSRGIYWVGTNSENYSIGDLEKQYAKEGKLIGYIHPEMIKLPFAAEVDTSHMDPFLDLDENRKDPTNSIKILRPDLIKINYTIPVSKAVNIWQYNSRYLPSSQYELAQFWKAAQAKKSAPKPRMRRRKKKPTE